MKWLDKLKKFARILAPPPVDPEETNVPDAFSLLSPRERDVFMVLLKVRKVKDAAEKLGIKYATLHTHCRKIYKKLKVGSHAELILEYGNKSKN